MSRSSSVTIDTKTDFNLNNFIVSLSLVSISLVKNSLANVLKPDLNSAQWMPKLVNIDDQNHAAVTSQSLPAMISLLKDNWPPFHYGIGISGILPSKRILPYKHVSRTQDFFACTVLSHSSIMLPPRVFARQGSLAKSCTVIFMYMYLSNNCNSVFEYFSRLYGLL